MHHKRKKPRVLFILKKRRIYHDDCTPYGYTVSSGLANSARFVNDMLREAGIRSHLVEVNDNNDIDREVSLLRPHVVVIEALWVVPEKFEILRKLHPNVQWVVRIHSEIPFLAMEGVALEWIQGYLQQSNVHIALNSAETYEDFLSYLRASFPWTTEKRLREKLVYLPNFYPVTDDTTPYRLGDKGIIDVGCFGAIRPMKNQLMQAFAALKLAQKKKKGLRFHINVGRCEQHGHGVLKNLRSFFGELTWQYQLVEHEWLTHDEFVDLVRTMDIGLQVSFSESFNITTADFVNNGVPVVVSDEVKWVSPFFRAEATSEEDIFKKMQLALLWKRFVPYDVNKERLIRLMQSNRVAWLFYLSHHGV